MDDGPGQGSTVVMTILSSVIVFLIASIVIFITGFICGHCFSQKRKKSSEGTPHTTDHPPSISLNPGNTPLYDYILTSTENKDLELKENVAYGRSE